MSTSTSSSLGSSFGAALASAFGAYAGADPADGRDPADDLSASAYLKTKPDPKPAAAKFLNALRTK
jgi:hypothetical protein